MLLVKTLRVLPYIQNIHIHTHTHTLDIINDILYALSLSCNLKYIKCKMEECKTRNERKEHQSKMC